MFVCTRCTMLLLSLIAASPRAAVADERSTAIEVQSVVVNLIAEVEVAAEEAGPLIELAVTEGNRVKKGDLLGRLDDRDAALTINRSEIALKHAQQLAAEIGEDVRSPDDGEQRQNGFEPLRRAVAQPQEQRRRKADIERAARRLDDAGERSPACR